MAYSKKSVDSIFADVLMVLLIVTLIMLVSLDVSQKKEAEQAETSEISEKSPDTLEIPTNTTSKNPIESGLIIEMLNQEFVISFEKQKHTITSDRDLAMEVVNAAEGKGPDVILVASPDEKFQEVIGVLELLDSKIDWTTPQVGTF